MASSYYSLFRLKDEMISTKIYADGKKFDVGAGKQFKSIDDLILHKKYPVKTITGVAMDLDQFNHNCMTRCCIIIIGN